MDEELYHYGMPRRSGRYPWGSGENPHQHDESFLKRYREYKAQGMSQVDIAKAEGVSTTQLRAMISLESTAERQRKIDRALELKSKGLSNTKIAEEMGLNESSVRNLLNPELKERANKTQDTASQIMKEVNKYKYVDIGSGVETTLGVTENRLKNAIALLEAQGYKQQLVFIDQMGTNHKTTMKVLTAPDVDYSELMANKYDIHTIGSVIIQPDGSRTLGTEPPSSISSDRIKIRYAEEGGIDKDGFIEIRRGVDDLNLGNAKYAQVRIAVDGTHYLKGMAAYSDDIPDGVDVIFNTNKHVGTPMKGEKDFTVLKPMKDDPDNPFGASIKLGDDPTAKVQRYYIDPKTGEKKLSAINVVNEEGDWDKWSKTLASQFLSKQSPALAKKQLDASVKEKQKEFDEIMALENPVVRKKLLESFSDDCDSAAVDLKAAPIANQTTKVILPLTDIPENKVYAPGYQNGDRVCLVRYPHGGTFEIPELIVDNSVSKTAKKTLGNALDAIGINAKTAAKLSGADFDGDTVICIPTKKNGINIRTSELKELKNFDPKELYKLPPDAPNIKSQTKQTQMGVVTNLITDMTLQGAPADEIARAVKHSMVIIDSEKHHLDYKRSEIDNGIDELKRKYQNGGGASTLISKASSEQRVPERKEFNINIDVDIQTGEKKYRETGGQYTKTTVDKKGNVKTKVINRTTESTKMAEVSDANMLISKANTQMERIYANYANTMKGMANRARLAYINTPHLKYDPAAKKAYAKEVADLDAKLILAKSNSPKERRAQLIANQQVATKVKSNPELKDDKEHLKKLKGQEITRARLKVGAKKETIKITEKEWEAIQNGAISESKLFSIIENADLDRIKSLATPRSSTTLSASKQSRVKALSARGCTTAEIADALGVSPSTINKILNE